MITKFAPINFSKGKYLLLQVGEEKIVRCGTGDHSDIRMAAEIEIGERVKVLGGGRIEVCQKPNFDQPAESVRLFGDSSYFGPEPDREVSKGIIREAFPGYEVY